ncbi:MAG: DMT family transporter, partial [Pacificibacter sp.]
MRSLSDNTRGAILMMAAMAAFSINDAIMKGLVSHINLYQVLFLRGLLTLVLVMTVLTKVTGPVSLRMPKQDRKLVALRSAAEMTASIGIVTALSKMPFANVSAILQSSPLMIALGAALVFRQPIGWRRMLAIGIGFVGVLFIVKPGPDGFEDGVLWVLLGVISVTVRDLSVRGMSSAVSTSTVTLGATLSVTVLMGLISTTIVWDPMTV